MAVTDLERSEPANQYIFTVLAKKYGSLQLYNWIVIRQVNMGRPRASNAVRDFAALFAKSVTVPSSARYDWVARTGETSIFVLLSRLSPKVLGVLVLLKFDF